MHENEIYTDTQIVTNLIKEQFPQFAHLPIRKVNSTGTVNAIYRIGEEYYARLPLLDWGADSLKREEKVLSMLSGKMTLPIPEVVAKGVSSIIYPSDWAIYKWLPGELYNKEAIDEIAVAKQLAEFILKLRAIPVTAEVPKAAGRKPLKELDELTVERLKECRGYIDADAALKAWKESVVSKPWAGTPVWVHADLLRPNFLFEKGILRAVIDFGGTGYGDPALDVIPAWTILTDKEARKLFKELLSVDENTYLRARGLALHQAALIIPYYKESNPAFTQMAIETMKEILADLHA